MNVLLLPGALCTAAFYEELIGEPALAGHRLVAVTMPGHGGTPPPEDPGVENQARLAGKVAADLGCDVVVGHSMGANVGLEMVAAGLFTGPVVLLAPSLSRRDESIVPRVLDRLGRVLGRLPFAAFLMVAGPALRGALPAGRHKVLVAELRRNDPREIRRHLRAYLRYLDRHGSLAGRLCESGVPAWVVFGERDDIGITAGERHTLEGCPRVRVVTIPGAGHFLANQEPGRIAELVLQALDEVRGRG